jgi:hypothetical protein
MAELCGCCALNRSLARRGMGGCSRLEWRCLTVVRGATVGHTRYPAEQPIKLLSLTLIFRKGLGQEPFFSLLV